MLKCSVARLKIRRGTVIVCEGEREGSWEPLRLVMAPLQLPVLPVLPTLAGEGRGEKLCVCVCVCVCVNMNIVPVALALCTNYILHLPVSQNCTHTTLSLQTTKLVARVQITKLVGCVMVPSL